MRRDALLIKPLMYVVLNKHDPTPVVPWQPPDYPSTCTELNGVNKPPPWPHTIMSEDEVRDIQASLATEILVACHENRAKAKDPMQVEIALAHPDTTPEDIAQWLDRDGIPSRDLYNAWIDRNKSPIITDKYLPVDQFNALQDARAKINALTERIAAVDDLLRVAGIK